jgi:hypothetical protein
MDTPQKKTHPVKALLITILVLVTVWFSGVDGFIKVLFIPGNAYKGLEYYTTGLYQRFDNSDEFEMALEHAYLLDDCTPIDFYYIDYSARDSLVHGKHADFYALDLRSDEKYHTIKAAIEEKGKFIANEGDFRLIWCDMLEGTDETQTLIAFNDNTETIRLIMITHVNERQIYDLDDMLYSRTKLVWE